VPKLWNETIEAHRREVRDAILDTTAWWNFTDTLTLRAGVFNVTDQKYWWWSDVRGQPSTSTTLDAYTQPGRNVSASMAWRL